MFTTIALLRKSPAQQDRVTRVENALKRQASGTWNENWLFPIAFIGVSNSKADREWVEGRTTLHVIPTGWTPEMTTKIEALTNVTAQACLDAVVQECEAAGLKLEFFGQQDSAHTEDRAEVTAATPKPATKTAAKKASAKTVKAIDALGNRPLPVPSVLKKVRDLVKDHPKIVIVEDRQAKTLTIAY